MAVPPQIFAGSPRTLPTGADAAEGPSYEFYELRDNLLPVLSGWLESRRHRVDGSVERATQSARFVEKELCVVVLRGPARRPAGHLRSGFMRAAIVAAIERYPLNIRHDRLSLTVLSS